MIIKIGDTMFSKHQIINNNLYLYLDFNYEFSSDFHLKGKEKAETLYENVINYIRNHNIDFKKGIILLVAGGLVIGSLFIKDQNNQINDEIRSSYKYVEHIDVFGNENLKEDIFVPPTNNNQNVSNNITDVPTTSPPVTPKSPTPNTTPPVEVAKSSPPPIVEQPTEPIVTLYRYNGTVEELSLEDYVTGVVAAEMPALFNTEALKAQSVLARTYALKKMDKNQVLKDDVSNQVYKDIGQLKTLWGNNFQTYYSKIREAVDSTKGQYLTYNNDYIETVYHSTSNGKTEDAVVVWGNSFPYLKSVDSHWDLDNSNYLKETIKEFNILSSILGIDFNNETNIEILSRTEGDRVKEVKIDEQILKVQNYVLY